MWCTGGVCRPGGANPQVRFAQQLVGRLTAGVLKAFSSNSVLLLLCNISYLPFSWFPSSPESWRSASIFWAQWERNGFLQHCPAQLGSWAFTHLSLFPHRRVHCQLVWPSAVLSCGGADLAKFPLPSPVHPNSFCFVLFCFCSDDRLNLCPGSLDFKKGSLICGCLPKSVLSRFSPTMAKSGWGWGWFTCSCWFHSLYQVLYAQVGKTLPGSLGIWCQMPQLPQRHFCSWIDSEF